MTLRTQTILLLLGNFLASTIATVIFINTGRDHFEEDGFITALSLIQLFVISVLAYKIFKIRSSERNLPLLKHGSIVWLIISFGFLYLVADEYFMIHEQMDKFIHRFFSIQETILTDLLDDIIVGIYGLMGIGVLFYFRRELIAYKKAYPFFIWGFALLALTVFLDAMTNGKEILLLVFNDANASFLKIWLSHLEEALKLFAEAFFILGFYAIYRDVANTNIHHTVD